VLRERERERERESEKRERREERWEFGPETEAALRSPTFRNNPPQKNARRETAASDAVKKSLMRISGRRGEEGEYEGCNTADATRAASVFLPEQRGGNNGFLCRHQQLLP